MRKKKLLVCLAFVSVVCWGSYIYLSYYTKPDLTVVGAVQMKDGLGRHAVECIDTLVDEVSIGFLPTALPCYQGVSAVAKKIIKNTHRPFGKVVLFFDCVWTPAQEPYKILKTKKTPDQVRFAYSMVESSQIPPEWVDIFNEYFDAVIVPDAYYVKVYEQSGVNIPVFTVSLGLNLKPFLQQKLKTQQNHPFVFGNFGAGISRKNHKLLIEAFHQAFANNPDVILKINCRYMHPSVEKEILAYLNTHAIDNVLFTKQCLDQQQYLEEFKSLDCLVYLSKGEGFSIQPREAMALGIPIILTDNTAHKTICRSGLAKKIPSSIEEPAWSTWGTILQEPIQYGHHYNCKKEDVVDALLDMYNNYNNYLHQAPHLKTWAAKYDFSELKPIYLSLVKPQSIVLSTKNKIAPEGIYTNSPELYEKIKKLKEKGS
jgi:glycosyltransferase involved in cell wall biosynthesis